MQAEACGDLAAEAQGGGLSTPELIPQDPFDRIASEGQLHQLGEHLEAGQGFLQHAFRCHEEVAALLVFLVETADGRPQRRLRDLVARQGTVGSSGHHFRFHHLRLFAGFQRLHRLRWEGDQTHRHAMHVEGKRGDRVSNGELVSRRSDAGIVGLAGQEQPLTCVETVLNSGLIRGRQHLGLRKHLAQPTAEWA